jgi:hypothetical protein
VSYDAENTGEETGRPIDLVEFGVGAEVFRFTGSEDALTVLSLAYEPVAINRDVATVGGEESRTQTISIRLPASHPFAAKYKGVPPGQKTTCTIKSVHRGDLTDPRVEFVGIVRTVGFDDLGEEAEIFVLPLTGALLRTVPRFRFHGLCNHVLYDAGCGVNQALFTHVGIGGATADPRIITISNLDAAKGVGWATGGFVEVGGDNRGVWRHVATNTLVLAVPFRQSVGGATASVYAGCDHRYDGDCSSTKFDNQDRHGGFHFVPTKNPFATRLNG